VANWALADVGTLRAALGVAAEQVILSETWLLIGTMAEVGVKAAVKAFDCVS